MQKNNTPKSGPALAQVGPWASLIALWFSYLKNKEKSFLITQRWSDKR